MKVADMHCDTVKELLTKRREGAKDTLFENTLHMDLQRMKQGDYLLQNFAMFIYQRYVKSPYEECKSEYAVFADEMEKNKALVSHVRNYQDIGIAAAEGKIAALLTIEEGEACEGDIKKLEEFYNLGVRMMALTWNYDNSLSTSASKYKLDRPRNYSGSREGLTETGIEFVQRMEELGMIPDVSHMSDEGIEDMLQITTKPFVASHSNARILCPHRRNLTDDFIRRMGEKGCVIGANFYSEFLQKDAALSKVEWIVDHIFHMVNVGGIESVGLGSDFDGIDCELEMKDCSQIQMLAEALRRRGMTEEQIEKIFYKNVLRLYKELL